MSKGCLIFSPYVTHKITSLQSQHSRHIRYYEIVNSLGSKPRKPQIKQNVAYV